MIALEQSLVGGTDRGKYGEEADVSPATASADFRRLLDAGLVEQRGRGRNIGYPASEDLRESSGKASNPAEQSFCSCVDAVSTLTKPETPTTSKSRTTPGPASQG